MTLNARVLDRRVRRTTERRSRSFGARARRRLRSWRT